MAWPRGAKTSTRAPSIPSPKRRSLTAPPGFFFTTKARLPACPSQLTMGYARGPAKPGYGEQRELPGGEVERLVEIQVEGEHVVGEPTTAPHDPTERTRRGCGRLFQGHPDLEDAIVLRD